MKLDMFCSLALVSVRHEASQEGLIPGSEQHVTDGQP